MVTSISAPSPTFLSNLDPDAIIHSTNKYIEEAGVEVQ